MKHRLNLGEDPERYRSPAWPTRLRVQGKDILCGQSHSFTLDATDRDEETECRKCLRSLIGLRRDEVEETREWLHAATTEATGDIEALSVRVGALESRLAELNAAAEGPEQGDLV